MPSCGSRASCSWSAAREPAASRPGPPTAMRRPRHRSRRRSRPRKCSAARRPARRNRRACCCHPPGAGSDAVDPTLIIFGIRALVRLWRGGAQAYAQYARDKAVLLPRLTFPPFDDVDFIRAELLDPQQVWRISANGPLVEFWSTTLNRPDPNVPGSTEALYLAALHIFSERAARESALLPERGREVAGEKLI